MWLSGLATWMLTATLHAQSPLASRKSHAWTPAGPDDLRSPCPMMNTLANHGYLPHDGKNLTQSVVVAALKDGLNFDEALGAIMFEMAVVVNPEPNATHFNLQQLSRHNVLEHDASLSRLDAYFGDNQLFNRGVFDSTRSYWTGDELDAQMLANSKLFRQIQSRAFNPDYTFSKKNEAFSLGETCAPIVVFGDLKTGKVRKDLVEYFFENERLPAALGWTKKSNPIALEDVMAMSDLMANATDLLTDGLEFELF